MIKREFYRQREDGVNLYITYSDEDFKILQEQTDAVYDEAIDVEDSLYTYIETDEKVEKLPEESENIEE